jgi:hypothetical protein
LRKVEQMVDGHALSLDGVEMRAVDHLSEGLITAATLFTFAESDAVVSARYAGGRIVLGYLIGKRTADGIEFSYVKMDVTGRIDTGQSRCDLTRLPDRRLRLVEHFKWASREGEGVNVLEEVRGA